MDVEGKGKGGSGKDLGNAVVKSEPVQSEVDGAVVVPSTELAGSDPVEEASHSYDDLAVVTSEHMSQEKGGDTTECSSSFGSSFCDTDDEADHGDSEVNSPFLAHADGNQASTLLRKKKVTAEWRNAVRPMLWRCQWLELRMKDLLSQVSKYDRQLDLINQEKESVQKINKSDGSGTELGKLCEGHQNIFMERRKRKRHEDTADSSLYIKKHQILSYFYDKQNKGAEADGLLVHDNHGPVGDNAKGRLGTADLPTSKEYDMVTEQFTLHKILLEIGVIQSRLHRLQERLSKARSKQVKMADFMDHAQVKIVDKRQKTQKRSFSYKKDQYTKPQKKKNLNILLEEDNKPALAVTPTFPYKATDCLRDDVQENSEEKSGKKTQSEKKAMRVDLLLGVDSSLTNGHMGDLCNENTDDVLIDNQAAKEGYQLFENVKHPLEKPPELTDKVAETAPSKTENTSIPLQVEKQELIHEPPAFKYVYSGKKRGRKPKTEDDVPAAVSKNQNTGSLETPASKQKTQTTTPITEEKNVDGFSEKQEIVNIGSAAKKLDTENLPSGSKKLRTKNSPSDAMEHAVENSPAAPKKLKAGNWSSPAKKHAAGSSSSPAKKHAAENTPTTSRIEKAILVEVNSRRSQRVRKPKIY